LEIKSGLEINEEGEVTEKTSPKKVYKAPKISSTLPQVFACMKKS